jgi:hypothetical protein
VANWPAVLRRICFRVDLRLRRHRDAGVVDLASDAAVTVFETGERSLKLPYLSTNRTNAL